MGRLKEIGKISAKNNEFEWKIPRFLTYNSINTEYRSPSFLVSESRFFLQIAPNGYVDDDTAGNVSLYIQRKDSGCPLAVFFSIGIKTAKNIERKKESTLISDPAFDCIGIGQRLFIRQTELRQRRKVLVPSGNLTIVCSIKDMHSVPDHVASPSQLVQDFKNLLSSKLNTDILLNVKGKSFSAHKTILAARSPVFTAMFNNEMTEQKTGMINISDCDAVAFDVFLLFLYSGEIHFTKCNVGELYKISDKYDVSELKLACVDFMSKNLSLDNFKETLILSDKFNEIKLLTELQRFFNGNCKDIISSDIWEPLFIENFHLVNNLLKGMTIKDEEAE